MLKSFKNVANNDYKQQLYILTDHKTNKAKGFKDLKSAAISINVDYSRYKQHFCTFYSTLGCKNGVFFNLLRFNALVLTFFGENYLRKSQKALETCVNTRVW